MFLSKGTSFSIEEVQGIALLELLYSNIFRAFFMEDSGQAKTTVFKLFGMLSKSVKCYKVTRDPEQFGVDQLVSWIKEVV